MATEVFIDYKSLWIKGSIDSVFTFRFADLQVLITKRSISGPTRYEAETYLKYLDNFDSEEWLLDQVLTNDLANNIQVLLSKFWLLLQSFSWLYLHYIN